MATVKLPFTSKSTAIAKHCTLTEAENLLNAFKTEGNPMHYTFFFLLTHSGIRSSETLALTWNDLDVESAKLIISKSVHSLGTSSSEVRYNRTGSRLVSLDKNTIDILLEWKMIQQKGLLAKKIDSNTSGQFIFQNAQNRHFSPIKPSDWLRSIKRKYDVAQHVNVHQLRQIFTTHIRR